MRTEEIIIRLFCMVDDKLAPVNKRKNAALPDTAGEIKKKAEHYEREHKRKEFGTIEAMKDGEVMLATKRRNECL